MDLENAFKQIDKSCFLREIRRVAPGRAQAEANGCPVDVAALNLDKARGGFGRRSPPADCFQV